MIKTSGSHGADISSQRIDYLDKQSLDFAVLHSQDRLRGLDIGCGSGLHGVRLALLGIDMVLLDILDLKEKIDYLRKLLAVKMAYIKSDARALGSLGLTKKFDLIYSQRFIHYLTYDEADKMMGAIAALSAEGAMFFISASGINSELGDNYAGRSVAVEERFAPLDDKMAKKHNILENVCLYSKEELSALLVKNGFIPFDSWESSFGNVKIQARKK